MSIKREALYSSATDEWETPQEIYGMLDKVFHFTLDACATAENAKCEKYYTREQDGLQQPWTGNVWCNPPYGRDLPRWLEKARREIRENADVIVMLIHARTDTKWFHEYIYRQPGVEYWFIKGRLKFGGALYNAPFPSMIAVFRRPMPWE